MNTLVKNFNSPASFLNSIFHDFEGGQDRAFQVSMPAYNIIENDQNWVLELAAPGLKKEDFKISLHENKLTISAEVTVKDEVNYKSKGFAYNSFSRTFFLPKSVEVENIEATYADGILKLHLPKKEASEVKSIAIG